MAAAQTIFAVSDNGGTRTWYSHSYPSDPVQAFHLIQQKVDVSPAEPQILSVEVPGSNGSVDLTEALGVGIKYKDRRIVWTYALYPGDNWETVRSKVSNALNGKLASITLDSDPDWRYTGRLRVSAYTTDRLLRQITIEAICYPYKRRAEASTRNVTHRAGVDTYVTIGTGEEWQIPSIISDADCELRQDDITYTLRAGIEYRIPEWYSKGAFGCVLQGATAATVTFSWWEGSL